MQDRQERNGNSGLEDGQGGGDERDVEGAGGDVAGRVCRGAVDGCRADREREPEAGAQLTVGLASTLSVAVAE